MQAGSALSNTSITAATFSSVSLTTYLMFTVRQLWMSVFCLDLCLATVSSCPFYPLFALFFIL